MPRILVIEGEEKVRSTIRQYLAKANFEVIEAEGAETAVDKMNNGNSPLTFDAAICNIRIAQIDGTETIRYFREKRPALPLIVIATFADAQRAEDLLKEGNGVKAYLVKPIGKESLLLAVNKAVGAQRQS
jgi:DNA-binding NtrC family response regulator